MSDRLASARIRFRQETDIVKAYVKMHSVGFILPAVVFLVEIAMIPTRLFAGGTQEPASVTDQTKIRDFRNRALKIDCLICGRVLVAVLALFVFTPQNPWFRCVVWFFWFWTVTNIVASAIHYGIVAGRPAGGDDLSVLMNVTSIPRVILLSLLNYVEVILWFAAVFAMCGEFNVGNLLPLDALYFSGMTVFTVGYGDLAPKGDTRLLALIEVAVGVLILVVLLGRMIGSGSALGEYARKITPKEREQ